MRLASVSARRRRPTRRSVRSTPWRTTAAAFSARIEMLSGDLERRERLLSRSAARRSSGWTTGQDSRLSRQSSPTLSTLQGRYDEAAELARARRGARRGRRRQRSVHLATGAGEAPGPRRSASTRRRRCGRRPHDLAGANGRCSATMATSCSILPRCSGSPIEPETATRRSRRRCALFERKGNVVSADRHERC